MMSVVATGQNIALTMPRAVRMVRPESGYKMFVKAYVENELENWERREPGESTGHYRSRVTNEKRKALMPLLEEEARDKYLEEIAKTLVLDLTLLGYDSHESKMILKETRFGRLEFKVPNEKAAAFEDSWSSIDVKPNFFIYNDTLGLARAIFSLPTGDEYMYINNVILDSMYVGIPYMLTPVYIFGEKVRNGVEDGKFTDVDRNIPKGDTINKFTWVVIIANENYRNESKVKYAKNDAETFRNYCMKTFCIPKKNIKYITNATMKDIDFAVNWMSGIAKHYGEKAKIIVYYAGHGISSKRTKKSYLVPVDGQFSKVKSCYSVDLLIDNLGALPVASATLFIDAGFNCYNRKGETLMDDVRIGLRSKNQAIMGNVVAIFAAQGSETAYQFEDKKHGVFTHFLLNEIQNNPDEMTLGGLFYEVQSKVKSYSLTEFKKMQSPTVIYSAGLGEKWKNVKLR